LLLYAGGAADGPITVGLYSDNGTTPGSLIAVLETFDDSTLRGGFQLVTLVLAANPGLSAETRYWMVFSGRRQTVGLYHGHQWNRRRRRVLQQLRRHVQNEDGGGFQMEVGITPAPEPSTFSHPCFSRWPCSAAQPARSSAERKRRLPLRLSHFAGQVASWLTGEAPVPHCGGVSFKEPAYVADAEDGIRGG